MHKHHQPALSLAHYCNEQEPVLVNAWFYEYYYHNLEKDVIDLKNCRDDIYYFNDDTPLEKIRSWYKATCANGDYYFGIDVDGDFPWVKDIDINIKFDEYFDKFIAGMEVAVAKMEHNWNQVVNKNIIQQHNE